MEAGHFGDMVLTLLGVLARGQTTERAMRTKPIVILSPGFQKLLRIRDGRGVVDVQEFIAQATVETFDKAVLYRLSRPDEVRLDAPAVGPSVQRPGGEFGAVIARGSGRCADGRSKASTTCCPVRETSASSITLSRLH